MNTMISTRVKNVYQSHRLRYMRIVEDNQAHRKFIGELFSDPEIQALTSSMLLRPAGKDELNYLMGEFSRATLGMIICLLPSETSPSGDKTTGGANEEQPVMIGEIILGEGGIPSSIAHNRAANIGLSIAAAYQGKGYGREAINWMLDWAFRHGAMHSVALSTVSYNTRAMNLYEDLGFVHEGRRRQVIWFDRTWHDDVMFSMTEEEWEALRGKNRAEE